MKAKSTIRIAVAASAALLGSHAPAAQAQQASPVQEKYLCPPPEQAAGSCKLSFAGEVQELCSAIDGQTIEGNPKWDVVVYTYQSRLFALAGAAPGEEADAIYAKVRQFFAANRTRLSCNAANFNPRNGDILKLGIARKSTPFLDDVLVIWGLDLNYIDPVDGKTVLDYIVDRRAEVSPASSLFRVLDGYYSRFRRAGALTADQVRARR